MTERVTIAHGGEMNQTDLPTAGKVTRSTDFKTQGVTVRSTQGIGGDRVVTSQADINDSDIVEIDGMTLTAKMARELGLMNRVIDEGLSVGAAAKASEANSEENAQAKSDTGHAEFDGVIDGLNEALEDGVMEMSEAVEYETAAGEIALAGLSVEHALATIDGLESGAVEEADVPVDVRQSLASVEAKVTEAAAKSAKSELTPEAYAWLSQTSMIPGVARMVRQYAVDRAQGKAAGITWSDFAQHVAEELGHR